MSRIGRSPVVIPDKVKITQSGAALQVEGPKGTLSLMLPGSLSAKTDEKQILIQRQGDEKPVKALHGLYRALVQNMVNGVTNGFSKELEVVGVGYRAVAQGKTLELTVGFSHVVKFPVPDGITVETPKPTMVIVKGIDRQLVGQVAANIQRVAKPEPYKGKGIRFVGQVIRRKAGKAATGAKGGAG